MVRSNNVAELRKKYPEGTIIQLISMDDIQAPLKGTYGTVMYVDDMGSIHMRWDTGSSLAVIEGVDEFRVCRDRNGN